MSTRAVIAFEKEGNSWEGVYSHFDGYPTGLGAKIWEVLQRDFLQNGGGLGIANTKEPTNAIKAFIQAKIKGHKGGWSVFDETCYCHDKNFVLRDGGENEMIIKSEQPDPLFHEFVYILRPEEKKMTILEHKDYGDKYTPNLENGKNNKAVGENENGKIIDYGHCIYGYKKLADIDLLGAEPNWEELEKSEEN